jgi:5-amino-6-(5-phosphoribosylamino)uracil reductase
MFDPERGGRAFVAHAATMPAAARARLAPVAELVELGATEVAVEALLAWLAERGVRTLLCEGGGEIVARLCAARALDEIYLTLVPRLLGGRAAPTMVGGPGLPIDGVPDPTLTSLERVGDELFLRYEIDWAPHE